MVETKWSKLWHSALLVVGALIAVQPDVLDFIGALQKQFPEGSAWARWLGIALVAVSRFGAVAAVIKGLLPKKEDAKTGAAAGLLFLAAINLATPGCAWWQKHGSQLNCAVITTVENAPQLITIVGTCAHIAVTSNAIIPCIEGAAGSKWAEDVIKCFTADAAGVVSCPAAKTEKLGAAPTGDREKLREAVAAQGWSFAP